MCGMELLALVVGAAIPKGAKKVATTNVSASDGRTVEYEEGAKRNDPLRHYTANSEHGVSRVVL